MNFVDFVYSIIEADKMTDGLKSKNFDEICENNNNHFVYDSVARIDGLEVMARYAKKGSQETRKEVAQLCSSVANTYKLSVDFLQGLIDAEGLRTSLDRIFDRLNDLLNRHLFNRFTD